MSRVDVDLHQLELRHHDLRIHDAAQRRRLLGSVAEIGQQVPVIVIREAERLVLIDGYLRVEALRKLGRDTAAATAWPVTELEALVQRRHFASASAAIEDGWLLARLRDHGLSLDELGRRLCRSKSWVSRRLALIEALPPAAQARVRAGTVPPHAAMKYLVPLARANRRQCELLVAALGEARVTDRELGALYDAWRCADRAGKQRIVAEPLLFLRALVATTAGVVADDPTPLHKDLTTLAAIAWRAGRHARDEARLTVALTRAWRAARDAFAALEATLEEMHAGSDHPTDHPETS